MAVNELSFDPRHAWFPVSGLSDAEWTLEVFTIEDVRLLDAAQTTLSADSLTCEGLMQPGMQRTMTGRVAVALTQDGPSMSWRVTAQADLPIKAVKLLFRGLPTDEAEGWWTATTPRHTTVQPSPSDPVKLRYPWPSWQTPWISCGEGPGITLSVRDTVVAAKRFYTFLPPWSPSPVVEIICDQSAWKISTSYEAPEIRLTICADQAAIQQDLQAHLEHLQSAYGLVPWAERTDVPKWADGIRTVVTLHGQHWTGHVFNTFDQMCHILEEVPRHIPGDQVLAYLPGWEGRYYWQYPQYSPGPDMGGEAGFGRLVETSHRLGVHLMPMFGANGANVRRFPEWEKAAFRSPQDRYVVNVNFPDWDGDRKGEDDQVFLNPGEPAYRAMLAGQIKDLVGKYDIEGVFLDTSACWFDDPRHDLYDGYRALVAELKSTHPELLICGEGWYDALLALLPMNQTWLDVSQPGRFTDLPYRYSRLLGHLYSGCPGEGSTGAHEGGYREVAKPLRIPGFAPSLGFVGDTLERYADDVVAFCQNVMVDDDVE